METTPAAPNWWNSWTRGTSYWPAILLVWSAALVYQLWPSFRWQIEYFKTPGPTFFYGILIVVPLLTALSLVNARLRGRGPISWEPLLISSPLLILAVRQPWGAAVAVLLLGSSLVIGRFVLIRSGLMQRGEGGEWTFSLLTGVSLCAWFLSMAGLAGLMSRPLLWAAAVLPAIWSLNLAPHAWRSLRGLQRRWADDAGVKSPLAGILIPFLALALLSGVLVAAAPPIENDAVKFHLPLAQKWSQTGSLTPSFDHEYSFYPQSFEVLMAWAYSIGGTPAAKAFSFALAILGFAICWRLVRLLGGSRGAAAAGMAIIISAPALHWTASVLKNDFLMAAMQVGCAACFLRWRASGNFRWILLGAWFLGSSFGIKHSALFAGFGLGLLGLRPVWEQKRRFAALAAIAVIMAATASVWHLRAYWFTGDPGYPAGASLASGGVQMSVSTPHRLALQVALTARAIHGHSNSFVFENILPAPAGTLFSLLVPLAFFLPRDRFHGDRRAIGFVVVASLGYWVITVANLRYAVTPLLLLGCLLAVTLARAYAEGSRAVQYLLSGVVVYGLIFGWTGALIIENSGPQIRYVAGLMSEDAYIASVHRSLPAIRRLGQMASPEDRVLGTGVATPFTIQSVGGSTVLPEPIGARHPAGPTKCWLARRINISLSRQVHLPPPCLRMKWCTKIGPAPFGASCRRRRVDNRSRLANMFLTALLQPGAISKSAAVNQENRMIRNLIICTAVAVLAASSLSAQQPSPPAEASTSINGKAVTIKYHSPSVKGRDIFGSRGLISGDRNYPIWRAGANAATALHTELDLKIGDIDVPAGDYTLYVSLEDADNWVLVINKQTGQWGLTYDKAQDLGLTQMTMSKPAAKVESLKYTLTPNKLELAWEDHVASVPLAAK